MKKIIILLSLLTTVAVVYGVETKAQTLKPIQFAKGKNSATVKENTGSYGVSFIVRAKSGQKLILNLTPVKQVGIKVETDGAYGKMILLREETGGIYEVGLEESGDYTILIGSTNNHPVAFTLTVKIVRLTDI